MAITAAGNGSVAAHTIYGGVRIESRPVHLAPGAVQPPNDIGVPVAGAHNLPRPPNPIFVGREHLLTQVAALFAPSTEAPARGARKAVGQAITGLGGIGKSEMALQYAAARIGPGAVVWWADAENPQTLELAVADLAYRLQPATTAADWTTTEAAAWATGWLQAHTGWLLVFDNVDDAALISPILGRLTTGDILITTRRDIAWPEHGVTPVALDVLPRPASIELLRKRLARPAASARPGNAEATDTATTFDVDAFDELAAELGDLPLALQQAAGYLTAHRLPLATYLQRLRQQTGVMLGKTAPGADPQRAVARVFTLTIDALQTTAPATADILYALGWLAPVPLPREVITELAGAADVATAEVDELLGVLASYSLITLTTTTVAVHRLLQACLRQHDRAASHHSDSAQDGLTGGQATALGWLTAAAPSDPDINVDRWGLWRDLLPHLDALFDHLPPALLDPGLSRLLNWTAVYLQAQGRYQHALRLEERSLAITEATLGQDDSENAIHLSNLALTLTELGRPADALSLLKRALAITETTLGPERTGSALNNLAIALSMLGRYMDALPVQRRALATSEGVLGPDHPTTAHRLINLAHTLRELGRPTEALPLQQRALAIVEAAFGPDHPVIATGLLNAASTLKDLGRYTEALPLLQRALAIEEAALGPGHPRTAIALNNLAGALLELGRPADALPSQRRAVAVTEATLGPHHPQTATALNSLAAILAGSGRPAEALPLLQRAVAITETALGPDHPTTALRLDNLARTLGDLGRHPDALPLQQRALAVTEATLGPDHPTTALRLNNLAHTLDALGRDTDAAAVRERIPTAPSPADDSGTEASDP